MSLLGSIPADIIAELMQSNMPDILASDVPLNAERVSNKQSSPMKTPDKPSFGLMLNVP